MADPRNCLTTNQPLELHQILEEARHRWLRPIEILEILGNYQRFKLSPEPPVRPSAGSLFLFDRKALRYFRKDGHCWRKKKDGKTVREAHEKLKAGSVDVLHCYYAHGEENDSFQRRCYWMLDGKLEHIVLVHYREVKEGYRSGVSHVLADPGIQIDSPQPSSAPSFARTPSPACRAQTFCTSIPNRTDWDGQPLSSYFYVHPKVDLGASSLSEPISNSLSRNASLLGAEVEGFTVVQRNSPGTWFAGSKFDQSSGSSLLPGISCSSKSPHHMHDQKNYVAPHGGTDFISHKLTDSRLNGDVPDTAATEYRLITDMEATAHQRSVQIDNKPKDVDANNNAVVELKKLDSFGRWMDKEIGGDCNDSLMASDSGKYWNTLGAENDDKEVSSLSHHMQLDIESMGPSLSQEQLFTIHDFSPDWAFSGVETKVLIIGTFLGSKKFSTESKWGCMFGEIEVFAEVLTDNVIRCQAPLHATGRVPFYVTCCNRLACSEVREFEYRENPARITSVSSRSVQEEELQFQVRLVKLLCLCPDRTSLNCSIEGCSKCKLISTLNSMRNDRKRELSIDGQSCMVSGVNFMNARDKLIQSLLKDRLFEWLVFKVHGGGKGPDVLDNEGQGVIHLAAALGYEWSMVLIVTATNNPNFRDALGRTALHWASYFGREETVISLVRLGVDPTAVDDPTAAFPGGRIAADLASSQGHKGIAGYLAEAFLTRNLSTLNIKENATDSVAKITSSQSNGEVDDQISLRESLAVVIKSTLAAALIQAAYRSYSSHHGNLPKRQDDSEVPLGLPGLCTMNKNRGKTHFEDYFHSAAVKIQQKYRGWKGRRDYIKMRLKVLKIQARVRGNRVRKQYKKVIWSVSIVEKAILRWRRKGSGLRGFRVENTIGNVKPETDITDEYEFFRISREQKFAGVEKALERVKSMVRDPAARDQYMRLVAKAENLKMSDEGIKESRQDECLQ